MDPTSQHVLVDLWLDEPITGPLVEGLLARARERLTVLREVVHAFEPVGLTALFVLSESHFALHTYPEARYLSLDVYLCNRTFDVDALVTHLVGGLRVRHMTRRVLLRGQAEPA